jgi:acetyl esterase
MPVNQAEKKFFDVLSQKKLKNQEKPLLTSNLSEFRKSILSFDEFTGPAANIPVDQVFVPTRDGSKIPVLIYNSHLQTKTPALFFYPGNGYVVDLFAVNAIAASRIAYYVPIKICVVNTRLAPEHFLPTAIYDAFDATNYIIQHAVQYLIDERAVFIGGICSGAHCAAVIANISSKENKFKICHQILLNGYYDLTHAAVEFKQQEQEDRMLTRQLISYLSGYYGISKPQLKNPLFSPYYANFVNLPATTFIIGEYDGVRGDSEAYCKRLTSFDVDVRKIILPGQTHNTFLMRGAMSEGIDPAEVIAKVVLDYNLARGMS